MRLSCISRPFTHSATLYNNYLFCLLSLKLFLYWLTNTNKNKQNLLSTLAIQFISHLLITANLLERINYTLPHIYFLAVCFLPFHSTESFLYTKWLPYWHIQWIFSSHITWSHGSILSMLKLFVFHVSGAFLMISLFSFSFPVYFLGSYFFHISWSIVFFRLSSSSFFSMHHPFSQKFYLHPHILVLWVDNEQRHIFNSVLFPPLSKTHISGSCGPLVSQLNIFRYDFIFPTNLHFFLLISEEILMSRKITKMKK